MEQKSIAAIYINNNRKVNIMKEKTQLTVAPEKDKISSNKLINMQELYEVNFKTLMNYSKDLCKW